MVHLVDESGAEVLIANHLSDLLLALCIVQHRLLLILFVLGVFLAIMSEIKGLYWFDVRSEPRTEIGIVNLALQGFSPHSNQHFEEIIVKLLTPCGTPNQLSKILCSNKTIKVLINVKESFPDTNPIILEPFFQRVLYQLDFECEFTVFC